MILGSNRCCNNNLSISVTGPQGVDGPFGNIGNSGLTGSTGATGYQGNTGLCYVGYKGAQGSPGAQGGTTGSQGPIGPPGGIGNPLYTKNIHFSFTTTNNANYGATYVNLLTLASNTPTTTIQLARASYAIYWQINETWLDPENNFYITLLSNPTTTTNTSLFKNTTPNVICAIDNKLNGIGNESIVTPGNRNYTIQLWQSTNSGNTIDISNQTINFNITFVQIN